MNFTVLIADDEVMPRTVLKEHIPWEALSVTQVHLVTDGEEAVEQARKLRPEIIISDIKMPRRNGLEMAAAVREFLPECQFIFMSGYSDKEYLKGAIRLRAACYVEKPLDLEEITAALKEITAELLRHVQPTEAELFFSGSHSPGTPLNQAVYTCGKNALSQLEKQIRHRREAEVLAALGRMYEEIRQCEGTSPEYLRHLYCQIIFLFLHAAETHNVQAVTERTDFLLYTTVQQETLAVLWKILCQTARDYFSALSPSCPDITVQVENFLEAHYCDCALTVQSIAWELGFTNSYLCAAYKKNCGKTINQRLTEIRIHHAKELLGGTSRKLYEIANAVGYGDGKYFVKLFTREVGLSPKEYRGRHLYEA
ncbi:MAG: response regulator [Clostridia bacterium]